MKCANPLCENRLHYLRGGTLRLLELETAPDGDPQGDGGGFPVARRTARFFWLCPECSHHLVLRRWTPEGLVIESRLQLNGEAAPSWRVPPEPVVDIENLRPFRRRVARSA